MHLSYGLESSLFGGWGGWVGSVGSVSLFDPAAESDRSACMNGSDLFGCSLLRFRRAADYSRHSDRITFGSFFAPRLWVRGLQRPTHSFFGGLHRLKPHFMHSLGHMADAFLMLYKLLGLILEFGLPGSAPRKTAVCLFRWLVLAV